MIPVFVDVRDRRFTRSLFATKVIDIARYRHQSIADVSARSRIAQVAKKHGYKVRPWINAQGPLTIVVFYSNVTFNDDKSIHNYAILKLQLCIFQSRQIAGIL